MSRNFASLIGGIILIISIFLPILSIFTTYRDYNITFHYWAVGIMYVYAKNGDGTESGMELYPNIFGIGLIILLVVFGILIIIKGIEGKDPTLNIIFGIISMVAIFSFTVLMYFLLRFALYNIGLGNVVHSLMPSYGFYIGLIGATFILIGGVILKNSIKKSRKKIPDERLDNSKQLKSQKIETKICQNCGGTNRIDDNFCVECGAAMK